MRGVISIVDERSDATESAVQGPASPAPSPAIGDDDVEAPVTSPAISIVDLGFSPAMIEVAAGEPASL